MSLTSAMLTGVAALDANSQAMSITSSNIANVNTVGYKDSNADFSTFLTSSYGSNIDEAGCWSNRSKTYRSKVCCSRPRQRPISVSRATGTS